MPDKHADAILQRLIRILSKEIVIYTKLLTVLEEKQQAIVSGEIEKLYSATENEQAALSEAKKTEKERKLTLGTLANSSSDLKNIESLRQLISVVEYKYNQRLNEIRDSLKNILEKVALKNDQNKFLLSHSIDFVQTMIKDLLSSRETMSDLYTANGGNLDPKYLAMLDRRV